MLRFWQPPLNRRSPGWPTNFCSGELTTQSTLSFEFDGDSQ